MHATIANAASTTATLAALNAEQTQTPAGARPQPTQKAWNWNISSSGKRGWEAVVTAPRYMPARTTPS